jgi:hypothetical protein
MKPSFCPFCSSTKLKEVLPEDEWSFVFSSYHEGSNDLIYDHDLKSMVCENCDKGFYYASE